MLSKVYQAGFGQLVRLGQIFYYTPEQFQRLRTMFWSGDQEMVNLAAVIVTEDYNKYVDDFNSVPDRSFWDYQKYNHDKNISPRVDDER